MPERDFSQHTVIITGASLGVGRACAAAFYARGANVVLVARRREPLEEAAAAMPDASRVLLAPADVADLSTLRDMVRQTRERFGEIHGLVNNAGAHARGNFDTRSAEELAQMVDVNLRAPIALTRLVLPHLREAGGGFVINVASLAGKLPLEGAVTYSATKFGLRAFSFALAEELRGSGITVSAVSPGPIRTSFIMDHLNHVADITFSQAMCSAEDVAQMVLTCARDGRREREYPVLGGKLATLAYLVPSLRRLLKPRLVARGRRQKERLRREGARS